jgi:hypothetical protein
LCLVFLTVLYDELLLMVFCSRGFSFSWW